MYRKVSRIVQRPPLYPFPVSPTISTPTQCLYTLCLFSHSAYLFSKLYERKLQMWQPFAPKFLSHNLYKDIHLHYQTLQNGMGIRFLSHLQNMFKFHQLSQWWPLEQKEQRILAQGHKQYLVGVSLVSFNLDPFLSFSWLWGVQASFL